MIVSFMMGSFADGAGDSAGFRAAAGAAVAGFVATGSMVEDSAVTAGVGEGTARAVRGFADAADLRVVPLVVAMPCSSLVAVHNNRASAVAQVFLCSATKASGGRHRAFT
ncbi:hypothetical protein [Sphingomonas sp. Leaf412]|uniref:hypothetical protein n=1 Tax=Sphingomonas sp. Leaf412 TaxID=1736370 RepID=UPI00138F3882|nr:hypothetical protein [Sphingomonas sp. Leaf412]